MLKDQLYEDILINIKKFEAIRFYIDKHPTNNYQQLTVYPWPQEYAINRYHKNSNSYKNYLERLNLQIISSKVPLNYYGLNRSDLKKYSVHKSAIEVDYDRFRHIRNYIALKRLELWEQEGYSIDIELEYRDTQPNIFSTLSTSNNELIDYLMEHEYRDELNWKIFQSENKNKRLKIHYTQADLVFKQQELFPETTIKLKEKGPIKRTAKYKGYFLSKDKPKYNSVVEKSYENFSEVVSDQALFEKCRQEFIDNYTESL